MSDTSNTTKYLLLGLCVISTILIIYLLTIKNRQNNEEYIEKTPEPIILMRPNAQEVPLGRSARGGK
jgi:hypothetical protein